ncbi:MAG: alcohol dehydrogenase catalytic domain-containing protein [Acidimicrobiia bacterium]
MLRGRKVETRETADPVPGEGQLLLKVLSCAICASDLHFMDNPEAVAEDDSGLWDYQEDADIVMVHEFVGEIVGHGPNVDTAAFPIGAGHLVAGVERRWCAPDHRLPRSHPRPVGSVSTCSCRTPSPGSFPTTCRRPRRLAGALRWASTTCATAASPTTARSSPSSWAPVTIGLSAVAALARPGHPADRRRRLHADAARHREGARRHALHVDPQGDRRDVWKELALGGREAPSLVELNTAGPIDPRLLRVRVRGPPGVLDGIVADCPPTPTSTARRRAQGRPHLLGHREGIVIHFGGGPKHQDWYGTSARCAPRPRPEPGDRHGHRPRRRARRDRLARRADGPRAS